MSQREDQLLRDVVSALSTAMVTIVRAIVIHSEKSDHPLNLAAIINALKHAGSSSANFSHDAEARTMQLTILKNIAEQLENDRARTDTIPLPLG
jgi:hypothetical protein